MDILLVILMVIIGLIVFLVGALFLVGAWIMGIIGRLVNRVIG